MALTDVNLFRIDGSTGSISTASINNIKNSAAPGNNIVLNADGTTTLTPNNIIKSGTAVASTSGTSVDFTGIPSWVKKITVMFQGVSTNGTSNYMLQLGTGETPTFVTSGYLGTVSTQTGGSTSIFSSGYLVNIAPGAADLYHGVIYLVNITGDDWCELGSLSNSNSARILQSSGSASAGAPLTAIRITTVIGTQTFDAGTINILFEG
jgi:hypothetical protein